MAVTAAGAHGMQWRWRAAFLSLSLVWYKGVGKSEAARQERMHWQAQKEEGDNK